MGNCISRTSKDHLLALEKFLKNKTSFEKGRERPSLYRLTRGTYTRIHSIKRLPEKITLETGKHRGHYVWLLTQSYLAIPKNLRRQTKAIFVWHAKERADLRTVHDENHVLTDD